MFLFRKNAHQIEQKELMEIDTVLWFNIAAAPVFLHQGKDWRIFGGYWAGNKEKISQDYERLQSQYSAVCKQDVLEKPDELMQQGEHFAYQQEMDHYRQRGFFALTPEQLRSQEIFPQIQPNQLNWLCRMIDGYKAYAENAVLAYDLCRAIAVAQMGFMVGHLTLEEGLKFCWQASVILQDHFSGWDELLQSYLLGMAYPQHGEEKVFCLEDFKGQLLQYDPQLFDLEWELPLEEKHQL